ncbi:cytochrome c-related protein [Cytophaga hutchinsonii ATCC 33406]|uniref:Cytochrome c-related protein n=2 Tax=Cytophaga hutchinsonii TaxID=985 RepID=A0A6N4SUW9_CYTH3|nr:cytochrome c-related protein [Cytophaga hutchinsonii ATCC 33406]
MYVYFLKQNKPFLNNMKKVFRIVLYVFGAIILLVTGLLTYVKTALPDVGSAPQITIKATPERIERGRYLSNSVSVCMDCHSTRDWSRFSGPADSTSWGKGGEIFDQKFGFPGIFYSKNITPAALSSWTDGEIYRAITSGVSKDGSALFPVMPHPNYGKMATEDIYSIIAYLRTLAPIENNVPESKPDFPMNFIINTIPSKAEPHAIPDKKAQVAYGKYLLNAAACAECHTKQDNGRKIAGMEFAGGFEFPITGGILRSSNITPDAETGIGDWNEAAFINRFKMYADSLYTPAKVSPTEYNTIMPWMMYAKMTREDLGAIYAYLKTVKPVSNNVEKFTSKK